VETFAGNGSNKVFTVTAVPQNLQVWVDGVMLAANAFTVSGQTVTLVQTPANGKEVAVRWADESIVYSRGIGLKAAEAVQVYRFFEAPERIEYRAGTFFQFGEGTKASPYTRKLPQSLTSDTIILETGSTLTMTGTLQANRLLELVAGEDLLLSGNIVLKGTRYDGTAPIDALYRVGGLFSLSGYRKEELAGENIFTAQAIYRRQLGRDTQQIFGVPLFVGGSVELGDAWQGDSSLDAGELRFGGSVYVASDTAFGPVYLAFGRSEGGRQSAYLLIGRTF
jgi:hypothetical protein